MNVDMKKGTYKLAFLSVLFAAIFGGGIPVFGKIGLREIPPFTFTFLRFFIATLFMAPFLLREKPKIGKNMFPVVLLSLFATANVTLFAFGVRLTTATVSQLMYVVVPIIAVILSYLLLKERISGRKSLGILVGFIGVATIIILPALAKGSAITGNLTGNVIILFAVLSFSIYSVLSKRYQKEHSPVYLTTIFTATTSVILLLLAMSDYIHNPGWMIGLSRGAIMSTLYVGIFGGMAYYLLYQYAIKHGTPVIASMTMFLQPVATFLWASLLLGEKLTAGVIAGAIFVFLGAYIVIAKKDK